MKKNYKIWTPVKTRINNNKSYPLGYKERDIWICNIGENIGFEEDGKGNDFTRPVLILKAFNRKFCHIVPLSTTDKRGRFYYPFDGNAGKTSVAILSQTRSIDATRLLRKVGSMNKEEFIKIKGKIKEILSL